MDNTVSGADTHVKKSQIFQVAGRSSGLVTRDQQPAVEGRGDRGGSVVDSELGVDVDEVRLDGYLGDEQAFRGLAVGDAARDQLEHFELAGRDRFR
jgi:hypothetical protein